MHLSDGVLSFPVVATTSIIAGGLLVFSIKNVKQEEIPKISLMTAAFFVLSLVSIPIGPSSVHPLLCGLLGILLGWRSSIAIFISLLLQALLFQHGGLTTLGANTLLVSIPAIIAFLLFTYFQKTKRVNATLLSGVIGMLGVIIAVLLLILLLLSTSSFYNDGAFSVVTLLLIGHIPLIIIEAILTAFIIKMIIQVRPQLIDGKSLKAG
ncbi:CbiM family transporter [Bacillus sp. B15-48]|uniref:CbiM family transporter n=1 Tax=Bacillus sp. B15-48 TaxID=1548601 RepID=UPI0019401A82|nr:CbiM family transporter [Bacillus sp. B15-48]MBM4765264.1 cobalt transporter CbiM [Bacillus sp. B15-48]